MFIYRNRPFPPFLHLAFYRDDFTSYSFNIGFSHVFPSIPFFKGILKQQDNDPLLHLYRVVIAIDPGAMLLGNWLQPHSVRTM